METIKKILVILDGKKTSISMIISAILVYLQGRALIANDTAVLISIICVALGLTVNYAEYKLGYK
jgi:hypothetical protein